MILVIFEAPTKGFELPPTRPHEGPSGGRKASPCRVAGEGEEGRGVAQIPWRVSGGWVRAV